MGTENPEPELSRLKRKAQMRDRPRRQVGIVRWLWPEIRDALNHGYSIRELQLGLAEVGVKLQYRTFALHIRQLRLADQDVPTAGRTVVSQFRADQKTATTEAAPAAENTTHDPLRNLREMREKGVTWEYKPPTWEDKDKLI